MQRKELLRLKSLWQLKSEKKVLLYPYYSLHEARAFQASSRLKTTPVIVVLHVLVPLQQCLYFPQSLILPMVSFMYPPTLLLDMNCEVSVVFPESDPPSIKTVYLGVAKDVFFDESV